MVRSSTTTAEEPQMFKARDDHDTSFGSPDLALLAFALLAVIAYILV